MISTSPKNFKEKTHLKILDEEFIDSKERLSDIINFLPDATFVIDSAGMVIAWNQAMEEMTQVKADEMLGKDRCEYSLPFYGERRKLLIDLVLSSNKEIEEEYDRIWWDGSSITAEIFIPSLNGKPTHLWGKATPLYDKKELIVGAIESIRDITDKKHVEKELEQHRIHLEELVKERTEDLREVNEELQIEIKKRKHIYGTLKQSEVKYKTIFENTGAATLIIEEDNSISLANAEFKKISGWSQEELKGKKWIEFVLEDDRDELMDYHYKRILERDSAPKNYEFRFLRKDKSIGHGYVTIVIVPGTSQRIASVIDITELKRAESKLKKSEEEYHSLYSSMSEGVALHDIIYNSDHEPVDYIITDVNPAYEKITGLKRSEAVGKRASELYGTGEPPYIEIYASVAESGEPVQFENYFEHVDKDFRVSVVSHNKGKFATFFEDVTQRKKAEKAKSELSSIVEGSDDAIIGRNLDGRITSWNKGAERLYGYSAEDAVGKNMSILVPENYLDDTSLMLEKIKHGKKVYHQETKRLTKDGKIIDISITISPIKNSDGRIIGASTIARDITERQKSEEELKRINIELSEMAVDLETILDIAPIVIWIAHDPECRGITGNAYADKIMRVHRGGNISRSAPIEDQAVSYKVFQNGIELNPDELPAQVAAATGEPVEESELDLVFSDGRIVKVLLGAVPLFDIDGKVRGSIAAGMDITHHKLIEDSLRESEERLRLAQTRGNVGVWDWNTITDELSFTPELEQLYGLSPGTIKTYEDWRQLTHPDDIEKIEVERDDKIAKHEPFDLEFRIFHKSGDIHWLSARGGAIYNKKGDVERVLGINTDITERKQAEEQVKLRTEELAKSNADLKQFTYVASHDLREPLRMISSFLQLLEKRYKDQLDEDANEFIGFAVDGAKRLDTMIMDLLEYSRVANKEIHFTDVDLEEVIDHIKSNLNVLIRENNAQITYDSLPIIQGDENQMIILFQNLISNAIKYRSEKTPQIHVSAEKEANQYVISVDDNAIGIDPKHLKRIFTIFQRLHPHTEYEGTGIGLSIAQRIVHQHGGEIWAESLPGKGSTFSFSIPI